MDVVPVAAASRLSYEPDNVSRSQAAFSETSLTHQEYLDEKCDCTFNAS
jgi:hypothetical protein